MEIWDLYDIGRNLTGRTMVRGEEVPDGCYHLVVHVWITDGHGNWLISQRGANRPNNPLKWECVGGHVVVGETSLQGALRETVEEVGVTLDPAAGTVIWDKTRGVIDGKKHNDMMDVWLFRYDGPVDLQKATTREVEQVKWMTAGELRSLWDRGEMVPSLDYFLEKVLK